MPGSAEAVLDGQHVDLVGDCHLGSRSYYSASLGDHQQVEPAHSEGAQDVLLVTVGAVWEKEAFFVPGALVHLFLVLPRQFEQLGESRDQYECVPQCGQFLSWLLQSRFSYEM